MSRSGSWYSSNTSDARNFSVHASAARRPGATTSPMPSRVNGSSCSVIHNAAADAPEREHSSEISPMWMSSPVVKYVYGEVWS